MTPLAFWEDCIGLQGNSSAALNLLVGGFAPWRLIQTQSCSCQAAVSVGMSEV